MQLDVGELELHPLSYADPTARLFLWRGGLYRAIAPERAEFFRDLFAQGIVDELVERHLLIDTELTDYTVQPGDLVVRHRKLPFVSYVNEWSSSMLQEAALSTLALEDALRGKGLALQDAHPWNVLFDGPRPTHVDFGSLVPASLSTTAVRAEFDRFFVNPLRLMAMGETRLARLLMSDVVTGTHEDDVVALRYGRLGASLLIGRRAARALVARGRRLRAGRRHHGAEVAGWAATARRQVEGLSPRLPSSEWSDYYSDEFTDLFDRDRWSEKQHSVEQILQRLRPRTVVDVAGNRGWYAQLAATTGATVVSFDLDETAVTRLHHEARATGRDILPLVMDVTDPSPGRGVANRSFPPATERFRCDLALGLAITHHLALSQRLRLEQVVAALEPFAERWLVIEHVSSDDDHVRTRWGSTPEWYTLDHLKAALSGHFPSISEVPSSAPTRTLLVCER